MATTTPEEAQASGSRFLTNVPELNRGNAEWVGPTPAKLRPAEPAATIQPVIQPEDPIVKAQDNIRVMMEDIHKTEDPAEKIRKMTALESSVGELAAQAQLNARTQAEKLLNRDLYHRQVLESENRDKQYPDMWRTYGDSTETQQARDRLTKIEARVELESSRLLKENPRLRALDSSVSGFLQMQRALIQAGINRKERTDARNELKDEEITAKYTALSPDAKEALYAVRPDLADKPKETVMLAESLIKGPESKQWAPIIQGTADPETLVVMAAMGSRPASSILTARQAKVSGQDRETAEKDLRLFQRFVAEAPFFDSVAKKTGMMKGDAAKQYALLAGMMDKGSQEQALAIRKGLLPAFIKAHYQSKVDSDLAKWPVAPGEVSIINTPEAAGIYSQFKQTAGRAPTVQEFYNLFVNDPKATPEMQSIRKTQMQTNYQKAIDAANKNVYGVRLDAADLTNKMQVRGILGRLSDRMVEMVGSPNLLRLTNPIAGDLSNTIRKEIPKLF